MAQRGARISPRKREYRRTFDRLLWVALLLLAGYEVWPQIDSVTGLGSLEGSAPSLTVVTLKDEILSIDELRGQVVLVSFWATWCPPCRLEMPGFESVYRDRKDDGFVILGLAMDRSGRSVVERYVTDRDITFPVALGRKEDERAFGGVRGYPTSFLIDRAGAIRHTAHGFLSEPALRLAVDRLLAEDRVSLLFLDDLQVERGVPGANRTPSLSRRGPSRGVQA